MGKAHNYRNSKTLAAAIALSFLFSMSPPLLAQDSDSGQAGQASPTLLVDTSRQRPKAIQKRQRTGQRSSESAAGAIVKYKQGVPCVPLMLIDDPNTLILTERDAGINAIQRQITLSKGKGVYIVGSKPLTIEAPLCTITLAGNSAAIIEQSENGSLRLDHLTGPSSSVSVKRWKGSKTFTAASGEEILIAPKQAAATASKDGIDRTELSRQVSEDGTSVSENKFAPKSMLDKECLLQCDSSSFFQVRNKVYHLRNSLDQSEQRLALNNQESMPVLLLSDKADESEITPVTFSETVPDQLPLISSESDTATFKYNCKTELSFSHPAVTELKAGELLLSAKKLSYVRTPDSMVKVEAGTVALISVDSGISKVRNLWENNRHGLSQSVNGEKFEVAAGDESLLSNELRSIYVSASKDMIGRRLTHYNILPSGSVIHFAEISLMSLAQGSDLLCQVMASSESSDREIGHKINKMAAILVQISASHGMYELTRPPQWRREARAGNTEYSS